jgi:glycerol-3-phosphate dehydrogenase
MGDILINTAAGRRKVANVERDQRVGISVIDKENDYNVVMLEGLVVEVTGVGADTLIDALAKKYLGVESYPYRHASEERLTMRIRPVTILMQP